MAYTLVSIRAPAKGAMPRSLSYPTVPACFNPRPREGSDMFEMIARIKNQVSIRAPAKGAMPIRLMLRIGT